MISLVTGGSGFIGARLLVLLAHYKYKIRLLSRSANLNYETIICDFEREPIPQDALKSVDIVFHLAGCAHDMRNAVNIEHIYNKINIDATVELAQLAVKNKVKIFIFVSSVKAGNVNEDCAKTSSINASSGVYGKTKREAELKLLAIGRKSVMKVVIIRSALVYGPKMKGNLYSMLLAIKKGWFPPLPEVNNQRSMIHVDDLVKAILLVATDKRAHDKIFVATDGVAYSSRNIYESMCIALNKKPYKWSVPRVLFDIFAFISKNIRYKIDKLLGDDYHCSKKLQALGFKAKWSLKEMNETSF